MGLNDSGEAESGDASLSGLRSSKSAQRLEQIASLRARGIGENIDLPQLVVCGDQSAGKSSVLEGITGIPFPRDDGVCTKFPTEVILEHADTAQSIIASIIPCTSRSETSKTTLKDFHRSIKSFSELPDVIAAAGLLMGIRQYGGNLDGPAFVEDVLRIKVTGDVGLHLSIVDLPGLIVVESEVQTEEDVLTVQRMVDAYIEKPRTIILAVVQASNDIANQSIIKRSKQFDKAGQRTVGIITKPDLVHEGTEPRIALLAKNLDTTRLKLGFFLLKNPTPREMKEGGTNKQRLANELDFFHSSPWKEQKLEADRVGIGKLKDYLQTLLDRHIEQELPKVRDEIKAMIKDTEAEVMHWPKERPTPSHLRMHIVELATRYTSLTVSALSGDYHTTHADFFTDIGHEIGPTRLRALIHNLNNNFAHYMWKTGRKLQLSDKACQEEQTTNATETEQSTEVKQSNLPEEPEDIKQEIVSKKDMKDWVKKVNTIGATCGEHQTNRIKQTYLKTRGRELPGNYNHVLLTDLYHYQSQLWPRIAEMHIETVHEYIQTFADKAAKFLQIEDYVLVEIQDRMEAKLEENKALADKELARLVEEEKQQPITYNHYYADNVQKSRLKAINDMMEKTVKKVKLNPEDDQESVINMTPESPISTLHGQVIVDMDERACSEALVDLDAYYKVRSLI